MSFEALGLPKKIQNLLSREGLTQATPIQSKGIPPILEGKDVLGIAKTGSGKTLAYTLPILTKLEGKEKATNRHIKALILVPTRELAVQVGEVVRDYGTALTTPLKSMAVYGGVSINPQMKGMMGVEVLIATPGRLLDLVDSNAIHFKELEFLVLDEADKMLNLGFKEEMAKVFALLPIKRQNLLFSATLSPDLTSISDVLLKKPTVIKVESEKQVTPQIEQQGFFVTDDRKGPLLRYLIKKNKMKQVLVFVSSAARADRVSAKLIKNGIESLPIHGKKSQGARQSALRQFKDGTIDVLVTTDLLARGIDINELRAVINYELPRSPKDFIHRIGRTGRADAKGLAVSFIEPEEIRHFKVILKKMKAFIDIEQTEDWDLLGY